MDIATKCEPKIVLFDLETLMNLEAISKVFAGISNYPGLSLKADINSIICFGYKILGDKKTHCINAWDYPIRWKKNKNDDYDLVKAAYEILKDADCIVTHNGTRFDWKFLQTRLLFHGLAPLDKIKHVDTCSLARSNLYLFSNRLGAISKFLVGDSKLENGGWELWVQVLNDNPKSKRLMTDYCKKDVDLLESIFKKLRPFAKNIPNHNLYGIHKKPLCPNCGSTRIQANGTRVTKTKTLQKLHCQDCRSHSQADLGKMPR